MQQSSEIEDNFLKIAEKTEIILKASTDQTVKNNMKIIAERVKSFVVSKEVPSAEKVEEAAPTTNDQISAKETPHESSTVPEKVAEILSVTKDIQMLSTEATKDIQKPNDAISDSTNIFEMPLIKRESNNGEVIMENEESEVYRMSKEKTNPPVIEAEPKELRFPEIQIQANPNTKSIHSTVNFKRPLTATNVEGVVKKMKLEYISPLDFLRTPKNKYGSLQVELNNLFQA